MDVESGERRQRGEREGQCLPCYFMITWFPLECHRASHHLRSSIWVPDKLSVVKMMTLIRGFLLRQMCGCLQPIDELRSTRSYSFAINRVLVLSCIHMTECMMSHLASNFQLFAFYTTSLLTTRSRKSGTTCAVRSCFRSRAKLLWSSLAVRLQHLSLCWPYSHSSHLIITATLLIRALYKTEHKVYGIATIQSVKPM